METTLTAAPQAINVDHMPILGTDYIDINDDSLREFTEYIAIDLIPNNPNTIYFIDSP